jgi:hypothetical protein
LAHWDIDFEDLLIDLLSRMICTASQRMFLDEVRCGRVRVHVCVYV